MGRDDTETWQELIVEHSQFPHSHGVLGNPTHEGRGENPFCGDRVTVTLRVGPSGLIEQVACQSVGCAISMASASMLAEHVRNCSTKEAGALFQRVHEMLAGEASRADSDLGDLEALRLVRRYPSRVKCATLSWHAFRQALEGGDPVSTE